MTTRPIPLDEAIAALDTPKALADRRKRAAAWAKELEGDARAQMFRLASRADVDGIYRPFQTAHPGQRLYGAELHKAEVEAGRIADAVVLKQCEIALRRRDEQELYAEPGRMEAQRIWSRYANGVAAIAWSTGDKEPEFIRRWKDLIAARHDAEEFDDDAAIRSIDARLLRFVGIPYPVLPQTAWDAADELSESERPAEYERLKKKYGDRPGAESSTTTKSRGRRQPQSATA